MPKRTVSVRLDETTLQRLAAITKATGPSRAALTSHAIERYAESEAWQVAAIQKAMEISARVAKRDWSTTATSLPR